jgi:hypothetical protein
MMGFQEAPGFNGDWTGVILLGAILFVCLCVFTYAVKAANANNADIASGEQAMKNLRAELKVEIDVATEIMFENVRNEGEFRRWKQNNLVKR